MPGQSRVIGGEHQRLLGTQPPDQVVVGGVAVCVLHGQSRLPDAAEAAYVLADGRSSGVEARRELVELLLGTREARIARMRYVPDRSGPGGVSRGRHRGAPVGRLSI